MQSLNAVPLAIHPFPKFRHERINQDVEQRRGEGAALCDPPLGLKGPVKVPIGLSHEHDVVPKLLYQAKHVGSNPVSLQYHQTPHPFHRIESLLQVNEAIVPWCLVYEG